jgi:hypothetical protein
LSLNSDRFSLKFQASRYLVAELVEQAMIDAQKSGKWSCDMRVCTAEEYEIKFTPVDQATMTDGQIMEFDNVIAAIARVSRRFGLGSNYVILLHDGRIARTDLRTKFKPADLALARAGDRLWFSMESNGRLREVRVVSHVVNGTLSSSTCNFQIYSEYSPTIYDSIN